MECGRPGASHRYIFNFNSKEELKKWHLYSDSEYGGLSSASLEISDTGNGPSGSSPILLPTEIYQIVSIGTDFKSFLP